MNMVAPYEVTKLSEGFWVIEEDIVRFYLIEGNDRSMLIDTGFGGGDLRALVESLTDKPIFVLNTHADPDHVGGNGFFDSIYMHPSEYDYYLYGHPERNPKLVPVWEGDVIDLGNRKYEVVSIPGHTPGSIALLDRENRLIFAGDSLQRSLIYMTGRGRNLIAFGEALKRLLKLSSSFDTIYTHHGSAPAEGTGLIRDVIASYEMLTSGRIKGVLTDKPKQCKIYDCGDVKFLMDSDCEL